LVRETERINDYVTDLELVQGGTLLVIHCILWQPVAYMHILRIAEFLSDVDDAYPPCIWEEGSDSDVDPRATETHLRYSARQMHPWDEVVAQAISKTRKRTFEYQSEDVYGEDGHHHARLAPDPSRNQIQLYQGGWWGADESDDERNDPQCADPITTVPLIQTSSGRWFMSLIADKDEDEGKNTDELRSFEQKPPLLATLTHTARQVGLWHAVTGEKLTVSAPLVDEVSALWRAGDFLVVLTRAEHQVDPRAWKAVHTCYVFEIASLLAHPYAVCAGHVVIRHKHVSTHDNQLQSTFFYRNERVDLHSMWARGIDLDAWAEDIRLDPTATLIVTLGQELTASLQ
jgi:hypothetical protein